MSRPKLQARMKALSFDEKVKLLEKLRDRSLALAASGPRQKSAGDARKKADDGGKR